LPQTSNKQNTRMNSETIYGAHTQAYNVVQPEAQLSLNMSLRHSKTLKVIRNDTLEYGGSKSLLAFHCNYVCILIIIIIIIILLSFVKFSASNNDLSLKPGLEVTQGH